MADYKAMYDQRSAQFDELNEQFMLYQQQTNSMITELEQQNSDLRNKVQSLLLQITNSKETKKQQTGSLERQLQHMKKQRNEFKNKFQQFQKQVVELQNANQGLQNQARAANCMLNEYQQRVEKTMEELALLQVELESNKESNQQQIARLRSQLKQTQDELMVLHIKHQKHNDQSQYRKSRMSSGSASLSASISKFMAKADEIDSIRSSRDDLGELDAISNGGRDFKKAKDVAFQNTINLVESLISQLDGRSKKLKVKKKTTAV